jgi:flagellar biosynthetic protein FliQ
MEPATVIQIGRQALVTVMTVAGPMLLAGLVVGLAVGIFQAVTQIHEMTLTFIPKILAIVGTLIILLPWMIVKVLDFTVGLFNTIPAVVGQ